MRKDLSTADCHTSGIQETISEFLAADENAVAKSQLSAGRVRLKPMAHGDAREGKWRGNWRMEWVVSSLHTNSEHGVSSITTADAHTSAANSRLNWRPHRFKWNRPFRRKTKSGFCECAITFQTQSNSTDENASTTFNYPASRNDLERYYWTERGPDQTGKQIAIQTKLINII